MKFMQVKCIQNQFYRDLRDTASKLTMISGIIWKLPTVSCGIVMDLKSSRASRDLKKLNVNCGIKLRGLTVNCGTKSSKTEALFINGASHRDIWDSLDERWDKTAVISGRKLTCTPGEKGRELWAKVPCAVGQKGALSTYIDERMLSVTFNNLIN